MFLVGSRKIICTAQYLGDQELHSPSTWKVNICVFLCISVILQAARCWPCKMFLSKTINHGSLAQWHVSRKRHLYHLPYAIQ